MKNLFFFFSTIFILSACASKTKIDEAGDNADSTGYNEQPKDNTQMNDTMQMQNADTMPH